MELFASLATFMCKATYTISMVRSPGFARPTMATPTLFEAAVQPQLPSRLIEPMYDIYLELGADLTVGSSGDLGLATAPVQTNQRVLRRLLTNPGGYIWNLGYGGGLATYIGSTTDPADIEAAIRTQMSLETAVPATPAPSVIVQALTSSGSYVVADITYADPSSGNLVNLNVLAN